MGYTGEKKKECAREWISKRRKDWFDVNGPCIQCGSTVDLELDHLDPKEKVTHRIWSWSQERRDKELVKCQVLCKICHRIKTNKWLSEKYQGCSYFKKK